MKELNMKWMITMAAAFMLAACDTDVNHNIPAVDAPVLVSTTPASDGTVKVGMNTIEITYDKNVFFAAEDLSKITLTGGTLISADVYGSSKVLVIKANLPERGTTYTLSIPAGVVLGPNQMPAPAVTISFSTVALNKSLVNTSATSQAQKVYAYLLENFEKKSISAMMANVAWNTEEAEKVFKATGKYPAINCFDYVHLPYSGENWIDYGDISPVKNWWEAGGLVAAMWHWNVPVKEVKSYSTEVWKGDQIMPADWSGYVQMTDDAAKAIFAEAQVGDKIKVTVKDVASGAQGSFKNGGWTEIASGTDYFDISGDYELTITEDILASLKSGGLIISGHDYTATGVYLTGGSAASAYAFYKDDTDFDATNALTEGTWENAVFTADLAKVAGYLKLLQNANIPVLWRPFHEAAGGWFWWGKDAASFKQLWVAMFNYFKSQGLNNLIWVWTSQTNDDDWYPGDAYVDIVSCDIYEKGTTDCVAEYTKLTQAYPDKIIALSECGSVSNMSEQWSAGAYWSWFMPWYGNTGTGQPHADELWWKNAMGQSSVITRDQLPSMK